MRQKPPQNYIVMPAEISQPRSKQLKDPLRHNPMNTKQAKHHYSQLICYMTMKKKVIHEFPTPFAHTTPIYHNNFPLLKII